MIFLDTNVVSELIRPKPDPRVETWLSRQVASSIFLSVISEAELRYGVALLPMGRRRDRLTAEIENMLQEDFAGRLLPFDRGAARALLADELAEIGQNSQADRLAFFRVKLGGKDIPRPHA